MKGVQCYELFGRIALSNQAFFIFFTIEHPNFGPVNLITLHWILNYAQHAELSVTLTIYIHICIYIVQAVLVINTL